jgi:hypothetical protein
LLFTIPWFYAKTPAPALGGGKKRYKPIIGITVIGPRGGHFGQILVDSGSDDVVFPEQLAARLGVDLSTALPGASHGVGAGPPLPVLFAPVILLLDDGKESCRWRAIVGFAPLKSKYGLFGIAGGLEYFRTTLDIEDRELLMMAKPSLPVTQDAVP